MLELVAIALFQFATLTGSPVETGGSVQSSSTSDKKSGDIGSGGWDHDKSGDIGSGGWDHDKNGGTGGM